MRLLLLPILAAAWLLAAAPALADTEHVWSLINRFGDSQHQGDWELGVLPGQDPGLSPLPGASLNHDWSSYGQGQDFSLSYDPASGLLTYTTQGQTLTTTLAAPDSVAAYRLQIEAFAQQAAGESSRVKVADLAVNGQPVGDELMVATDGVRAQSLALENLPAGGFTLTGKLYMESTHLADQAKSQGQGWVPPGHQGGHTPPGNAHGHQGNHPPGHAYGWSGTGTPAGTPTSLGSNLGAMFSLTALKAPAGAGGSAAAPEPATLLLSASALGALAAWRRRRKKASARA